MMLDRRILDIRLVAMLLIFLVASVALIPTWSPTQAAQASGNVVYTGCASCGRKATAFQNVKVGDVTILEGEERNKAIATALSSQDYKNVKQPLIEMGYTPSVDNATAATVIVYIEGVSSVALLVVIPFSGGADYKAEIGFMRLNELTMAASIIINIEDKTGSLVAFSMNGEVKFPVKGGDVVPLVQDECYDDDDCVAKYGPGYCCGQACEMNQACLTYCSACALLTRNTCVLICMFLPPPFDASCTAGCWAAYFTELLYCLYYCCWGEGGQVYKVCYYCGVGNMSATPP